MTEIIRKHSGSILYALICILFVSLYLDRHDGLEKYELAIRDSMLRMRAPREASREIALVKIDDASLKEIGKWPWDRLQMARFIDSLSVYRPKTIALGVMFGPDPAQQALGYSDSLARSIARAGNVILGYHFSQNDVPQLGASYSDGLAKSRFQMFDDPSKFAQYTPVIASKIYPPDPLLADAAAGAGFFNVEIDRDRKIRVQPLIVGIRGEFFPSLQIAATANYLRVPPERLHVNVGNSIQMGSKNVVTDFRGKIDINYAGPAQTFKSYSAADIYRRDAAKTDIEGKLVLVGFTASGATNIYATPIGNELSGLELNANIIENILTGNSLKEFANGPNVNLLILIGIGLLGALVLARIPLLWRIGSLVLLLAVVLAGNYFLMVTSDTLTKVFYPAAEIIFLLISAPLIKKGSVTNSGDQDEDEDDVDYEKLLASSQSISLDSWPAPAPSSGYAQTVLGTPPANSSQTILATAPVKNTASRAATAAMTMTASSQEMPTGTDHFGRYRILQPLGKGAMGMVYKGLDPAIDRLVALKTIRLDQFADPSEAAELRERLIREAKAAGKLSHPNIVTIYDVGEEDSLQYIAMEFLQGKTLESLIKRGLDWDYRTLSKVMIQASEALDYAHENGIVHRDIKPANIMILDGNNIKVMDFGIARLDKSASMTQTGTALGTPNYISPEQLRGLPIDRRSDIFSLGVVFYEILTGQKPFKGDTISALIYSILHTEPPRPSELNVDIPRIFDKITAKALVKDPDFRFQRARDIADILRKLI